MLVGVNRCPRSQAEYYVAAMTHSEPRRRDSARRIKNSRAHQNPPGAARGPPCRSRRVNNSHFWPKTALERYTLVPVRAGKAPLQAGIYHATLVNNPTRTTNPPKRHREGSPTQKLK